MNRNDVYKKIAECGIMPTTFVYDLDETVQLAKTLYENGIRIIELLQRTPNALDAIDAVKEAVPDMVVGAGTVLNVELARKVCEKNVDYIVSPYYHQDIVDFCNEHEVAVIPGCATITEVSQGYDSGLKYFKYFPTNQLGGIDVIRQISEIYADARYVATGGITFDDLAAYSRNKYVVAVGSVCMMPQNLISAHAWDDIADLCRKSVAASLGLQLIYTKREDALTEQIYRFAVYGNNNAEVPKELLEDADTVYYANSIERVVSYYQAKGIESEIVRYSPDNVPAVADLRIGDSKARVIARHYIYKT